MVDIIIKTAVTFFAIYGFVQIVKDIVNMFLADKNPYDDMFVVIKVKNSRETLEATVRLIMWKWLRVTHGTTVPNILIVDLGSNDETPQIAKHLCNDYSFIHYTTKELYEKAKSPKE